SPTLKATSTTRASPSSKAPISKGSRAARTIRYPPRRTSPPHQAHLRRRAPRNNSRSELQGLSGPLFRVDALGKRRLDEPVDIAVEHGQWVGALHARAQILHELIGLQHVRPDLMAEADVGFGGGCGLRRPLPAVQVGLRSPPPQQC